MLQYKIIFLKKVKKKWNEKKIETSKLIDWFEQIITNFGFGSFVIGRPQWR